MILNLARRNLIKELLHTGDLGLFNGLELQGFHAITDPPVRISFRTLISKIALLFASYLRQARKDAFSSHLEIGTYAVHPQNQQLRIYHQNQ